jgi:hypothetical protein
MTRSVRQNPFVPKVPNDSEKNDKRLAHQRERKWIHDHLTPTSATAEDFDIVNFHEHPKRRCRCFPEVNIENTAP